MSIVILLILASLAIGLIFVGAFVWSVRSGQYEDTLTPALRVLTDDLAVQTHSQPAKSNAAPAFVTEHQPGAAVGKETQ